MKLVKEILQVSLDPDMAMEIKLRPFGGGVNEEGRLWGVILADVVRHLGNACALEYNTEGLDVRQAVVQAMLDELASEDPEMGGGFLKGEPGG